MGSLSRVWENSCWIMGLRLTAKLVSILYPSSLWQFTNWSLRQDDGWWTEEITSNNLQPSKFEAHSCWILFLGDSDFEIENINHELCNEILTMVNLTMMTSPNENIFRVTSPLWGEFTGHRWIPLARASDAEHWCLLWSTPEQTVGWTIETPVIWDAMAPIMTSYCVILCFLYRFLCNWN